MTKCPPPPIPALRQRWGFAKGLVLDKALQAELIEDAELWQRIRRYRQLASRAFDENASIEVVRFVRSHAASEFEHLLAKLRAGN